MRKLLFIFLALLSLGQLYSGEILPWSSDQETAAKLQTFLASHNLHPFLTPEDQFEQLMVLDHFETEDGELVLLAAYFPKEEEEIVACIGIYWDDVTREEEWMFHYLADPSSLVKVDLFYEVCLSAAMCYYYPKAQSLWFEPDSHVYIEKYLASKEMGWYYCHFFNTQTSESAYMVLFKDWIDGPEFVIDCYQNE